MTNAQIIKLISQANEAIKIGTPSKEASEAECKAYRTGIASMLSNVLHMSNLYAGFCYIGQDGKPTTYIEGVTDETRRSYFFHARLIKHINRTGADLSA